MAEISIGQNVCIAHLKNQVVSVRLAHPADEPASHNVIMERHDDIATRIRALRKKMGMKQADFVAGLSISRSYLSKLENGDEQPGRELLIRMANEFNVSLDWITSGVGDMIPARALNEQEAALLRAFRALPPDEADTHLKLMIQRAHKTSLGN